MGLRKSNTVLVHFQRAIVVHQAVLVMKNGFFCSVCRSSSSQQKTGRLKATTLHPVHHPMVFQNSYLIGQSAGNSSGVEIACVDSDENETKQDMQCCRSKMSMP